MSEEQMKNNAAEMPGKPGRKKLGIIGAVAVILIALIVGVSIYNTPANRLARLLDLGYRYLEEGNYEQAAITFDKAIAIDDRCMEAYAGGIQSYQGLGDEEGLADIYERALDAASGLEESELAESMDTVVEIYLAADDVYSDDSIKAIEILKEGLTRTEDERIKGKLVEDYLGLANEYGDGGDYEKAAEVLEEGLVRTGDERVKEKLIEDYLELAKEYADEGNYERALSIYDKLLELDAENVKVRSGLENCLRAYFDLLKEQEHNDEIEELIKKYQDKVNIEDMHTLPDSVAEQAEAGEDSSWIDDLYQKMISGDIEAVYAILLASDFIEKCSEYAYEYQTVDDYNGTQYGLLTSEGKMIFINEDIYPLGDGVGRLVYAFYCVHEDETRIGFVPVNVSGGDYYYSYASSEDAVGYYNGRDWLIENAYHSRFSGDGVLTYGEGYYSLFLNYDG